MTFLRRAACALAIGCAGCFVQTHESAPPPAEGALELDWTINQTTDGNQCAQGSASSLSVTVFDSAGVNAGTYEAPCDAFATSIVLPADRYTATSRLVDANGAPRTTTIDIAPFDIVEGGKLSVPIDFPASSFL